MAASTKDQLKEINSLSALGVLLAGNLRTWPHHEGHFRACVKPLQSSSGRLRSSLPFISSVPVSNSYNHHLAAPQPQKGLGRLLAPFVSAGRAGTSCEQTPQAQKGLGRLVAPFVSTRRAGGMPAHPFMKTKFMTLIFRTPIFARKSY